jgi:hypothetical protein
MTDPVKKKLYNDTYRHKQKSALAELNSLKSSLAEKNSEISRLRDHWLTKQGDLIDRSLCELNMIHSLSIERDKLSKEILDLTSANTMLNNTIDTLQAEIKSLRDSNHCVFGAYAFVKYLETIHPNTFNNTLSRLKHLRETSGKLEPECLDKIVLASNLLPIRESLSPPPIVRDR